MKKILTLLLAMLLLVPFSSCKKDIGDASSEILVSVAESNEVSVKALENVFPENTVVKIEKLTSGQTFNIADKALGQTAEKFVAYDITATSENVSVQPNGTAKATFDIPDGYDLDNIAVIYVSNDGTTETLTSVVDKENKTVTAELSHFSIYAVVEKTSETENNESILSSSDENTSDESSKPTQSSKPTEPDKPASSTPSSSQAPACSHKYSDATCTTAKVCSLCGKTEGTALGHDYIEGVCSRCKASDATYKALTSGAWEVQAVANDKLYAFSFVFSGTEPSVSVGFGDNIKNLDEEFRNELLNEELAQDYADSIYKVGNEIYYVGMGSGNGITFKVDKNTVVITEIDTTNTITMTRTAGNKYTITALSGNFLDTDNSLKVGSVLVWVEANPGEA